MKGRTIVFFCMDYTAAMAGKGPSAWLIYVDYIYIYVVVNETVRDQSSWEQSISTYRHVRCRRGAPDETSVNWLEERVGAYESIGSKNIQNTRDGDEVRS